MTIFAKPLEPDGVTIESEESLLIVNVAAFPPTVTPVTRVKCAPVIVEVVQPVIGPDATETDVIVGDGAVKDAVKVTLAAGIV